MRTYNVTFTMPNGRTRRVTRTYYAPEDIRRAIVCPCCERQIGTPDPWEWARKRS